MAAAGGTGCRTLYKPNTVVAEMIWQLTSLNRRAEFVAGEVYVGTARSGIGAEVALAANRTVEDAPIHPALRLATKQWKSMT
jgi:hypothetical protein